MCIRGCQRVFPTLILTPFPLKPLGDNLMQGYWIITGSKIYLPWMELHREFTITRYLIRCFGEQE